MATNPGLGDETPLGFGSAASTTLVDPHDTLTPACRDFRGRIIRLLYCRLSVLNISASSTAESGSGHLLRHDQYGERKGVSAQRVKDVRNSYSRCSGVITNANSVPQIPATAVSRQNKTTVGTRPRRSSTSDPKMHGHIRFQNFALNNSSNP